MKAISLWQPWAQAIALGSKTIETRSWSTAHRGLLAIHASKRRVVTDLIFLQSQAKWRAALQLNGDVKIWDDLPFGAIVAICDLVDCKRTDDFTVGDLHTLKPSPLAIYTYTERGLGDFAPGRFGWVLQNVRILPEPIPYKGQQGFFNVPDELIYSKMKFQRLNNETDIPR